MSAPVTEIVVDAVLLATLTSLVAPVVPLTVDDPTVVGVPETVHVIDAPGATLAGGTGAHMVVKPAGSPDTAQVAPVAATSGAAPFEQVNVPE